MATAAGATALVAATAGCGAAGSSSAGGGTGTSAVSLTARGTAYGAPSGPVAPGASVTVTFTNADPFEHSFTLDDGSASVDAEAGTTQTLGFTAPQSGTIAFHCKYHSTMHGTLTVGVGGGAGAGGAATPTPAGGYSR